MYLSHWGLERSPFFASAGLGPAYPSEAFDEATARIDYLLDQSRRMGVLLGEPGWGKTTVLGAVAAQLANRGAAVALVEASALSPAELLWQTASGLGASPDPIDTTPRLWRRIEEKLEHHRWQGRPSILLVDDADQAGPDVQRQLVRLAGLEASPGARWTMILAADPGSLAKLSEPLLHRIDLRVDLFPWTADDTAGYVQHALVEAGATAPLFTDEALQRLHQQSLGVPRHVVRLADFALVLGAGAGLIAVGPDEVDAAFDQLSWSAPKSIELV
ncbi:MAG: AAA family ATPase [Planctomycetota bacterium]